jgi:hypothetical protein
MATIEKTIEVDVPVQTAYNQWTQFEEFPHFMEGVREVRQLDDERLYWAAEVGGERKEWYARITRQVPDEVIAWESEGGALNSGTVSFMPAEGAKTEVKLFMEYEPEDFKEQVGDALGVVSRRVEGDLKRFKEFIESRCSETGSWRGQIPGDASETTGRYGASGQGGSGYGGTSEGSGFGRSGETGEASRTGDLPKYGEGLSNEGDPDRPDGGPQTGHTPSM